MPVTISGGKLRRITRLAGLDGRFRMMAIDQRGSMEQAIQSATGEEAAYEQVAKMKTMITKILSPNSTAVLTDPIFGYPYSVMDVPRDVGLLLAFEESGYVDDGVGENERASVQIANWNIEKAIRSGADTIKLLIYYHPDASLNVCNHQKDFTKYVGEQCEKYDLPVDDRSPKNILPDGPLGLFEYGSSPTPLSETGHSHLLTDRLTQGIRP